MKVLVLGADGYLGWPTCMHLSLAGHEIYAVDNYLRRNLSREEDSEPLFEVPNLHERIVGWGKKSGKKVHLAIGDICDWDFLSEIFLKFKPDTVIHYAEQPSAPYSMKSRHAAQLTLNNNLTTTFNVIQAIHQYCPDCHLIKLGTMGEYGTPNIDIEEGWINISHKGREQKFLFPRQASSLYHTTKILDTDLIWFYIRTWKLRCTDLMQGPVYGIFTNEMEGDEKLFTFFNYDELFGTVLNRFIVQAAAGYPLTVYGSGKQTRGYLNIKDTMQCIRLALENPPSAGELEIYNQFTETFSVNQLAEKVQLCGKKVGLDVKLQSIENPRVESENHYYNPAHTGLLKLGLEPNYLDDETLMDMIKTVIKFEKNIKRDCIYRGVKWSK